MSIVHLYHFTTIFAHLILIYDLLNSTPESVWPIYIDDIMFNGWALGPGYECFDCRKDGGSITPPDFWED